MSPIENDERRGHLGAGFRCALVAMMVIGLGTAAWGATQVTTVHPRAEALIAELSLAPSEGDRTQDLQAAINSVRRKGGGSIFLAAGRYRISGTLALKRGVVLEGDYAPSRPTASTVLEIVGGRGDAEGAAAIEMEAGSGLRGLVFYYPEQSLANPVPYPWTACAAPNGRAGNNQTIEDCTFVNSWRAFKVGPGPNECHTLRRVRIGALETGIHADMITDIGRLTAVTISPEVWSGSGFLAAPKREAFEHFLKERQAVAVDFGRSDWEYVRDLSVEGYGVGVRFRRAHHIPMNGVMAAATIANCNVGLDIDELNEIGLSCYDCRFIGNATTVKCSEKFNSIAQFHSCQFQGGPLEVGKNGVISLRRCELKAPIANAGGRLLQEPNDAPTPEKDRIRVPAGLKSPQPQGKEVLYVADFGASPDLEDNSAVFQAALQAAAAKHCTVYASAGYYKFRQPIAVPAGVELRGSSSVPHHTMSGGSVFMVYCGRGDETGTPFCSLGAGAGLRGVSFWYPEQPVAEPVPYPWTIRSQGENCYLVNVNIGNAWQGADFATNPSTGHFISYYSGGFYRAGLAVANAKYGYVEDVQYNPHYIARRAPGLPFPAGPGAEGGEKLFRFQRSHLTGLSFRDCANELVAGTFLFASYEAIVFAGNTHAQVLIHGSDTSCRCSVSRLSAQGTLRMALGQFVPLGHRLVDSAAYAAAEDRGDARYYASQIWPQHPALLSRGQGFTLMDQYNSFEQGVVTESGKTEEHLGFILRPKILRSK